MAEITVEELDPGVILECTKPDGNGYRYSIPAWPPGDGGAGICTAQRSAKHFFVNIDEQKKAYWKWFDEETGTPFDGHDRDWGWECSNCGYVLPDNCDDPDIIPAYKYCMECGAEMIVSCFN